MTPRNLHRIYFMIGILIILGISFIDLICGDISLVIKDLFQEGSLSNRVLFQLRLPRVLTASLAGAALALSGLQMQSIFRNPLADPHIMGISSGASLGAALVTMAGVSSPLLMGLGTASASCAGAATAACVIIATSRRCSSSTLLIFGIMMSFAVNALVSIVQFSSSEEGLKLFYSWSAGSFAGNSYAEVVMMFIAFVVGCSLCAVNSKGLNIILFGDEFAKHAGASPERIRSLAMVSCCLLTGVVTAFCGPLGFVGIISPHIARWIFKTASHRSLIIGTSLIGASISLGADLIIQLSSIPLPAGSVMAIIGTPFVIAIMSKGGLNPVKK